MTASKLLELMRLGGYSITVDGDQLVVKEARWIDAEMADLIRQHKQELMMILSNEARANE